MPLLITIMSNIIYTRDDASQIEGTDTKKPIDYVIMQQAIYFIDLWYFIFHCNVSWMVITLNGIIIFT